MLGRYGTGRDAMGAWATGTWASGRSTLTLTRDEAAEFLTEHQRLISRYQRGPENAPSGARTIIVRFLTYPEPPPEQRDVPEYPASPGTRQLAARMCGPDVRPCGPDVRP